MSSGGIGIGKFGVGVPGGVPIPGIGGCVGVPGGVPIPGIGGCGGVPSPFLTGHSQSGSVILPGPGGVPTGVGGIGGCGGRCVLYSFGMNNSPCLPLPHSEVNSFGILLPEASTYLEVPLIPLGRLKTSPKPGMFAYGPFSIAFFSCSRLLISP